MQHITICRTPRFNPGKLSYDELYIKIMKHDEEIWGENESWVKNAYLKQSLIRHVTHSFALTKFCICIFRVHKKLGSVKQCWLVFLRSIDRHACQRPRVKFAKYFHLGYLKSSPQMAEPEASPEDRMSALPLFDIALQVTYK